MAGANFKDPKNNDLARPLAPYSFGSDEHSENNPTVPLPGSGGADDNQCTPEGRRAGYGHQYLGPNDTSLSHPGPNGKPGGGMGPGGSPGRAPTGGHNMDARNQYTVKMTRGSSL